MTKKNSRAKGARGERELANLLKSYGYKTRRGQQFSGLEGEDVVGLPGVHIECKRVERLNIYDAISQASRDSKKNQIPVVFHRKNNCKWLVTMEFDEFMKMENTRSAAITARPTVPRILSGPLPIPATALSPIWG